MPPERACRLVLLAVVAWGAQVATAVRRSESTCPVAFFGRTVTADAGGAKPVFALDADGDCAVAEAPTKKLPGALAPRRLPRQVGRAEGEGRRPVSVMR